MSFMYKLQMWMTRLMQGRNGPDNLSYAALIAALALSVLDLFLRTGILQLLSSVLYVYSLWRLFSRKVEKRNQENIRYVKAYGEIRTKVKQYIMRMKNSKEYKYVRCPQCKVLIRYKRGSGEINARCPKCQREFKVKA